MPIARLGDEPGQDAAQQLRAALGVGAGTVAAFTGGGGKTSLILALCRELAAAGLRPVFTTTTKIYPCTEMPVLTWPAVPLAFPTCVVAGPAPEGKLAGIDPAAVATLATLADVVLVEADGSKHLPLKCPAEYEPVIPAVADLVVPVVGAGGLGRPLSEVCHRAERAAALLGLSLESPAVPAAVVPLVAACTRGAPPAARVVPCINQADTYPAAAEELAAFLRAAGWPRVVLAAARDPAHPVRAVWR